MLFIAKFALLQVNSQLLGSVRLVNCTTSQEVQDLLQTIINRIQKLYLGFRMRFGLVTIIFSCNTNSIAPPTTTLGILGSKFNWCLKKRGMLYLGCDKLLADVLQAYVQLLQNKACQEVINTHESVLSNSDI